MTIGNKNYSSPKNINLKEGALRFGGTFSSTPFDSSSNGLYIDASNYLVYSSQGADTILGAAGAMVNYSMDDSYNDGSTIAVDTAAVTLAGASDGSINILALTLAGAGTGNMIDIQNNTTGSAGYDIIGTDDTWSVGADGAAVFTAVTGCDTLTAASDLAIDATGTGTITIGGTSTGAVTIGPALTATASLTITGSADSTVLTVTAGDVSIAAGLLTLDDDDTATGNILIPSSTATSGNVISITADDLTTGAAIMIDSDNGASFSGNGGYLNFTDGTNTIFKVGRYGALTIAGNAEGTASITCTKGDVVITDGALIITAGAFTYTAGDMAMGDGSLTIVDADNAATLSVTNSTATSESPFAFIGAGAFTGSTTKSWMTLTAAGLTSGTQLYEVAAALTTGKMFHMASGASQTTGTMLYVQNTGADAALTSGEVATFNHTATEIASSVNKIGNVVSVSSSRTVNTGGTTADDFDLLSLTKATTRTAGTAATTGSVLYVALQTTGTVTETSKGIEVVMDSGGTGDGVEITHAATAGTALDIIGAATTVSDVLITGSGAKADNKAVLEVTSTGSTAEGGAILRVTHSGTGDPAAATSYLADFDYTAATLAAHSVAVRIATVDTGAGLLVTSSGAAATGHLVVQSTNTGAVGAVINLDQTADSAAASDVVGRILWTGQDAGDAAEEYARVDCVLRDVTDASEDADLIFYVDRGGTLTQQLWLDSDLNGVLVGDGAATAIISSSGAYDLTIETNSGTNSGVITITDGANGDITVTPNGVGQIQLTAPTYGQVTAGADGAATLTIAMVGIYTIGNTVERTLTLPAAATSAGAWYTVVKTSADAAAVILDGNADETINGAATFAEIDAQYDSATVVCDGTEWWVVSKNIAA